MSLTYDVLLVEDNETERNLFRRACTSSSFLRRLYEVTDGQQALDFLFQRGEYADSPTPNVVVLDLNLPGVTGHEVLRQIKSDQSLKLVPVIVLTSSFASADVDLCYALGASAYVRKPAHYDKFCSVVQRLEKFWLEVAVLPSGAAKPLTRSARAT